MTSSAAKPLLLSKLDRIARAREISIETGCDAGVVEQVLFMQTLPQWERLARGLRRARLRRPTGVRA